MAKKFNKQYLLDTLDEGGDVVLENTIIDHGRWTVTHRMVFKADDGKLYQSFYRVGATESQDESPWEYDGDEIECEEVSAVEKTVTVYVPVATSEVAAAPREG